MQNLGQLLREAGLDTRVRKVVKKSRKVVDITDKVLLTTLMGRLVFSPGENKVSHREMMKRLRVAITPADEAILYKRGKQLLSTGEIIRDIESCPASLSRYLRSTRFKLKGHAWTR